ncbi:MAG: methyltransferase domain-containing protein [Propionibacteriaceae bacterium]|nr:methyltransferase domain-containing protein [Propionibacteriaceae bacterium]
MTTADFWEQRYASTQVWSGRVNQTLAEVARGLVVGSALDLGCGEGGDAIWLARAGWQVTAVDISTNALERGRAAAEAARVPSGRIEWVAADLASWRPAGTYDLVSACFLQSPVSLPRTEILRRAATAVAPGGSLLIISHAEMPPWANDHHHEHADFLGPAEEVAALGLDSRDWDVVLAEVRERDAVGPDGASARLKDSVVRARRARND